MELGMGTEVVADAGHGMGERIVALPDRVPLDAVRTPAG